MFTASQVHTSELKRLKGIRIEVNDNDQPFLVFTYKKSKVSEGVFAVLWWSAVAALYAVCGYIIWWYVAR